MRSPKCEARPLFFAFFFLALLPVPLHGYRRQVHRDIGAQVETAEGAPARSTSTSTNGKTERTGPTTRSAGGQQEQGDQVMQRRAFDRFMDAVNSKDLGVFSKFASRFKAGSSFPLPVTEISSESCDGLWLPPESPQNFATKVVRSKEQCAAVCASAIPAVVHYARSNPTARQSLCRVLPISKTFWDSSTSFNSACIGFRFDDRNGCYLFRKGCGLLGGSVSMLRLPAAAAFCANHLSTLNPTSNRQDVVEKCQQGLSGHDVCRQECEALVARMSDVRGSKTAETTMKKNDWQNLATGFISPLANLIPNLATPITDDLGLGELCLTEVVKLVESKHLTCCAAGCGWDPARKVCAGASLLSPAGLRSWRDECCQINSVLVPSDRQRMCDSALPALQALEALEASAAGGQAGGGSKAGPLLGLPASGALPARSEVEAFQFGEDLPEGGAGTALLELGQVPSINQVDNTAGNFSVCNLPCKQAWSLENSLVQCSNAELQEWFAPSSSLTCSNTFSSVFTSSPGECSEKAPANAKYASWKLTSGVQGVVKGECRHFVDCGKNWRMMAQNPKKRMDNVTSVLWKAFNGP